MDRYQPNLHRMLFLCLPQGCLPTISLGIFTHCLLFCFLPSGITCPLLVPLLVPLPTPLSVRLSSLLHSNFFTIDLCCRPVVNEVSVGSKVLPYSGGAVTAKRTFPYTRLKLRWEGVAIVVEHWPHSLRLSYLGRGGGGNRRLRVRDLKQNFNNVKRNLCSTELLTVLSRGSCISK